MFGFVSFRGRAQVLLAAVGAFSFVSSADAAVFADQVVSYDPGSGASLTDPTAALGSPDEVTGDGGPFQNVLSPFSPAYEADELVNFGAGGHLTLRLANFIEVGAGLDLGVVTNVGLVDSDWPNGVPGNPASAFGAESADVEVSADGVSWVSVGRTLFDLPAVYFQNAGHADSDAPVSPVLSDFGKPYDGDLSSFDGLTDYAAVLAELDGSGGGTWLDLSGTGLSQVGYVRFSNPDVGQLFDIDAVVIANDKVGAPVPEPASVVLLGLGGVVLIRRRRSL